jgi:hypothetical protein
MNFTVRIDDGGLLEKLEKSNLETKKKAWAIVRSVSFAVERRIHRWLQLSVDTGRARASWGHWQAGEIVKPNQDAREEDAVWIEDNDKMVVVQGTNVEYVPDLEQGSSKRAGSAGISKAADIGGIELEREISKLIDEVL